MRCPKCGYFSFDHHEACAKCDKELADVRQELNLQDFQPEVPFLLGSLVGDMEFAAGGVEQGLSLTQETEMALSGVDTSGPVTMEGTMDMQGMEQTLDAGAAGDVELDEIVLDDLEGIDAGEIPEANGAEIELEGLSGEGDVAEGPAGDDEEFRGLELDMEDLEETLAGGDASEFELTPSDEPADASAEDTLALELDAEPEIDTASEEPMLELNLDDDDLSALADELEDELGSEAKADAPAAPSTDDPGAMRDASWYPPELPERYGTDRLTLMVRDPHWLFCYWEVDVSGRMAVPPELADNIFMPDEYPADAVLLTESQRHATAGTTAADGVKITAAFDYCHDEAATVAVL